MAELTPSEVVLLNGERFASRRLVGNVRLLHTGQRVGANQLGLAVLRAAFLTNEERDVVRLQHGEVPRWFGRRSRPTLFVEPGRESAAWPRHTVEWAVPTFLEELRSQRGTDRAPVGALVDSLFVADQHDPWTYVVDLVRDGLVARGLLERHPERLFRLDTGRFEYALPEETVTLATRSDPERVERLFRGTGTARPEVWELLGVEIERAVDARLDTSSYYSYTWESSG